MSAKRSLCTILALSAAALAIAADQALASPNLRLFYKAMSNAKEKETSKKEGGGKESGGKKEGGGKEGGGRSGKSAALCNPSNQPTLMELLTVDTIARQYCVNLDGCLTQVQITSSEKLTMCLIGDQMIDTHSIDYLISFNTNTLATRAAEQHIRLPFHPFDGNQSPRTMLETCEASGGSFQKAQSTKTEFSVNLCIYQDNSVLDAEALLPNATIQNTPLLKTLFSPQN